MEGEREVRLKDIETLEEQMRRVDGEVATAETEKAQFLAAQRRTDDLIQTHRYSIPLKKSCHNNVKYYLLASG